MMKVQEILEDEAADLLEYKAKIPSSELQIPGADWIDRVFKNSSRSIPTLCSLQRLFSHGRLANTGYLSILPVDQGVEHSAAVSFEKNIKLFDPNNIMELALEGGCNGVVTTLGALSLVARKYAHKIPLILKLNHNELLTMPTMYDQTLFASVKQAHDMGCVAVGATIYFGSPESRKQISQVTQLFEEAHSMGLATILWCYLRNSKFKTGDKDFHTSADMTGQANHLGVTIGADIIKQKLPTTNGGFKRLEFGKYDDAIYEMAPEHPIDLCRFQVCNNYNGNIGLINSGGANEQNDLKEAVKIAIINKRAGGIGMICGRKAFRQPSIEEGVEVLNSIQDIYLDKSITIA